MGNSQRELDDYKEGLEGLAKQLFANEESQKRWNIDYAESKIHIESATPGPPARGTFRLFVIPSMANAMGNLHGGCTATMVDILTSVMLTGASRPGVFQLGGVSRNLNVTYLRPLPVGTEIRIVCEVTQVGRRMALLKAEIRRVDNDALCAVADHQKSNTDPPLNQKL